MSTKLLSPFATNAKTSKLGTELGLHGAIQYLSPSRIMCPAASPGCLEACLQFAGRMHMSNATKARANRTALFESDIKSYLNQLYSELEKLLLSAKRRDKMCVVRLNGTSDIDWMELGVIDRYPEIQFYDYTKRLDLAVKSKDYPNYQMTFSRSEVNDRLVILALGVGINVAVVFNNIPEYYLCSKVIDGDKHDFRFLDPIEPKGIVIGLKAKGKARKDTSGFVVAS